MPEKAHPILKNKPLVEAVFELRWGVPEAQTDELEDPYQIIIGRIYDRLKKGYPIHEKLATSNIPSDMAEYIIQHRFRAAKEGWPIVQLGPGILTVNDTAGYVWEDFRKQISGLVNVFFGAFEDMTTPTASQLRLGYVDGVDFDFESESVFEFLKNQLKLSVCLDDSLFKDTGVVERPEGIDLRFTFPVTNPEGTMNMRLGRGQVAKRDAIIWETMVISLGDEVPQSQEGIEEWAQAGHSITSDWFFKMIDGELLRRFG